ncbi:hypothetical protein [Desulfosediminicola flagellatus]|uniref:hypothetical protein n=1 Tax=Desulfosediminicola flagellatus TaxID=2569541 RepID=UPI0010ACDF3C|nr:hypothetical protein [Desulfosediminicola flagellatus]
MNIRLIFLTVPLSVTFVMQSYAGVNTLSGGIAAGYDLSDRAYVSDTQEDDNTSRFTISPYITILTESIKQSTEFRYSPTFYYDFDDSESDVDHNLSLDYTRRLTRKWDLAVSDTFTNTDQFTSSTPAESGNTDTYISPAVGSTYVLRDENGRRRYSNNSLSISTSYTYYEDSRLSVAYVYDILRNDDDDFGTSYEDYDKHDLGLAVDHRINSKWRTVGSLGYVRGLYETVGAEDSGSQSESTDDSDDVHEYRAGLSLENEYVRHKTLSLAYAFNESDYDSEVRADEQIHDITLGWKWIVSPTLDVSIGGGPTYSTRDDTSGEWDYNGNASLNYKIEKGSFTLSTSSGQDFENFSGTGERGKTEFWQTRANFSYTPIQYMTVSAYGLYRNEDREQILENTENQAILDDLVSGDSVSDTLALGTENNQKFSVGCGLSYRFAEKYVADITYDFTNNQSDDEGKEYDDHRVQLTLSYENDFFQW